jgi:hypothetical protein
VPQFLGLERLYRARVHFTGLLGAGDGQGFEPALAQRQVPLRQFGGVTLLRAAPFARPVTAVEARGERAV